MNAKKRKTNKGTSFLQRLKKFQLTFRDSLIIAISLHVIGLLIYAIRYQPNIIEVPFKTLHVKIGEMGQSEASIVKSSPKKTEKKPSQKFSRQKTASPVIIESPVSKIIKKPRKKQEHVKKIEKTPVKNPVEVVKKPSPESRKTPVSKALPKPKKKALQPPGVASKKKDLHKGKKATAGESVPNVRGTKIGNKKSAKQDKAISYEQLLSLWLAKHQVYPDEAKHEKIKGYAIIRLQINRDGHIIYSDIIKKTGYDILDRATREMIQNSNPAPPIPDDYPSSSNAIEFDIPIKFKIEGKN